MPRLPLDGMLLLSRSGLFTEGRRVSDQSLGDFIKKVVFLWPCPGHVEVPEPGVKLVPQL